MKREIYVSVNFENIFYMRAFYLKALVAGTFAWGHESDGDDRPLREASADKLEATNINNIELTRQNQSKSQYLYTL